MCVLHLLPDLSWLLAGCLWVWGPTTAELGDGSADVLALMDSFPLVGWCAHCCYGCWWQSVLLALVGTFALEDTELGNVCWGFGHGGHGVFAGGCSRSSHVPTKPPSHIRLWFMVLLLMHALHKVGHGTGARVARTVKLAEMILFSALHAACVNDCQGVLSTTWPLQQTLLAISNVALKSSLAIVSCAFCRPHLPKVLRTP